MTNSNPHAEATFLEEYRPEDFDRPSVAVDVALLTVVNNELHVLVVRRDEHPHKGRWALPGGFVGIEESLDSAAQRVLREKAGLRGVFIEQLYTFGALKRDPRMRIVSVAYYALVPAERLARVATDGRVLARVTTGSGDPDSGFHIEGEPVQAAFDHAAIVGKTVRRLRGKLNHSPIVYELLSAEFTLLDLQRIHEAVLGHTINKDSFRKRMLTGGEIEPTGEREQGVGHRPAALHRRVSTQGKR